MSSSLYRQATFLLGAVQLSQLPPDMGWEVAFAGRSNAGKSSALNVITDQKVLARVSKTPGRTREINIFRLDDQRRLIDLPGYGYAKVPEEMRVRWQAFLEEYIEQRQCLRGLIILMDIRHPLTDYDKQLLDWCVNFDMPAHVLLTKADKLSRAGQLKTLREVTEELPKLGPSFSVQTFSSLNKSGVDEARAKLNAWYEVR